MRLNGLFYITLLTLSLWSGSSRASVVTGRVCLASLEALAKDHFADPQIFNCGYCFMNSGELGRLAANRLGGPLSDIKLLVIRHKKANLLDDGKVHPKHSVIGGAEHTRDGDEPVWRYHAVLSYQNKIIDFDKKEGWIAVPFSTFKDQMLPLSEAYLYREGEETWLQRLGYRPWRTHNKDKDLVVIEIPLTDYLKRFPDGRPSEETSLSFIETYPAVPIATYKKGAGEK